MPDRKTGTSSLFYRLLKTKRSLEKSLQAAQRTHERNTINENETAAKGGEADSGNNSTRDHLSFNGFQQMLRTESLLVSDAWAKQALTLNYPRREKAKPKLTGGRDEGQVGMSSATHAIESDDKAQPNLYEGQQKFWASLALPAASSESDD